MRVLLNSAVTTPDGTRPVTAADVTSQVTHAAAVLLQSSGRRWHLDVGNGSTLNFQGHKRG